MDRVVTVERPQHLHVGTRAVPDVGPGEALIDVAWVGICGSDVDVWKGSRPADRVRYPIVPGHEWSGVVVAVGDGVDRAWLHRSVVGENIRSCVCDVCRNATVATCESSYVEAGFTIDGAWADHILVPVLQLYALPEDADLRSAAGIEPAACAATAVEEARIEPHHKVGVVGGGAIGLLCTQLISSRGADVTVVDPRSWRRPIAMQCGASGFVAPSAALSSLSDLDVVIEAAGVLGSVQMGVDLARVGGRVVICGIAPSSDVVRSVDIVSKILSVVGVFGATKAGWETAVAAFVSGNLDPGVLATHEFTLDEVESALHLVEGAQPLVGKVLIRL